MAANPVHFDLNNNASGGTFISTPSVSAQVAKVVVSGTVANETASVRTVAVLARLLDYEGRTVAQQCKAPGRAVAAVPAGFWQAEPAAPVVARRPLPVSCGDVY